MPANPTAEVLERAADLLERDGWCQGGNGRDGDRRCMMVAFGDAYDQLVDPERLSRNERLALFNSARSTLWGYLGVTSGATWNDAPERTAADVIAALRAAAKAVR